MFCFSSIYWWLYFLNVLSSFLIFSYFHIFCLFFLSFLLILHCYKCINHVVVVVLNVLLSQHISNNCSIQITLKNFWARLICLCALFIFFVFAYRIHRTQFFFVYLGYFLFIFFFGNDFLVFINTNTRKFLHLILDQDLSNTKT